MAEEEKAENRGRRRSPGVLNKELLLSLFEFQDAVSSFTAAEDGGKSYSLEDVCFKVRGSCLVNSPLEFWQSDKTRFLADQDLSRTVSQVTWESSFGPPISVRSVFGGLATDPQTGLISAADSLVITYFLEVQADNTRNETLRKWEHFWASFVQSSKAMEVFNPERTGQQEPAFSFQRVERTQGQQKHLYYKVFLALLSFLFFFFSRTAFFV